MDSRRQLLEPRDHLLPVHGWWGDDSSRLLLSSSSLASCPVLGPVVGSAVASRPWGFGQVLGSWACPEGAGMACPRAAGVVAAVWLSGALAQQVAFHPDALAAEPQACSWTPSLATWS